MNDVSPVPNVTLNPVRILALAGEIGKKPWFRTALPRYLAARQNAARRL